MVDSTPSWRSVFGATLRVGGLILLGCLAVGILLNVFVLPSTTRNEVIDDLEQIQHAILAFRDDHEGRLPAQLDSLLETAPRPERRYINRIPLDPWGRPYVYETAGDASFHLSSLGRDGNKGGSGEDEDYSVTWYADREAR